VPLALVPPTAVSLARERSRALEVPTVRGEEEVPDLV
jgi:hypothetical protein